MSTSRFLSLIEDGVYPLEDISASPGSWLPMSPMMNLIQRNGDSNDQYHIYGSLLTLLLHLYQLTYLCILPPKIKSRPRLEKILDNPLKKEF